MLQNNKTDKITLFQSEQFQHLLFIRFSVSSQSNLNPKTVYKETSKLPQHLKIIYKIVANKTS